MRLQVLISGSPSYRGQYSEDNKGICEIIEPRQKAATPNSQPPPSGSARLAVGLYIRANGLRQRVG